MRSRRIIPRPRRSRRFGSRAWLLAAILVLLGLAIDRSHDPTAAQQPEQEPVATGQLFRCNVQHVHDGDTLRCADGTRIRLNAIAARERDGSCSRGHPCPQASAEASRRALSALALGEKLLCHATGKSYNRVTAWCWTESAVEISCAMVRGGHAAYWARYDPQERMCNAPRPMIGS